MFIYLFLFFWELVAIAASSTHDVVLIIACITFNIGCCLLTIITNVTVVE